MRLTIAAVGRDRGGPTAELANDYIRRCPWPIRLVEVAPKSSLPPARRLEDEAARLIRPISPDAPIVALDERGRDLTSRAFAEWLAARRNAGVAEAAFVIGGADGLAPSVAERAALSLALGRMTWPHRLVRVMLLEQIYRAAAILAGHPYHRE